MPTIICPQCQQDYEIDEVILGRKVECVCGHKFIATVLSTPAQSIIKPQTPSVKPLKKKKTSPVSTKKKHVPDPPPPGPYANIFEKYPKLLKVKFGADAPTMKQFAYAYSLGVNVNGQTFTSISKAIDRELAKPIEKQKPNYLDWDDAEELYNEIYDRSPADKDQLKELREYHFQCNRRPTKKEAEEIIDKFSDYTIVCPACKETIEIGFIVGKSCPFCDAKFSEISVPIILPVENS